MTSSVILIFHCLLPGVWVRRSDKCEMQAFIHTSSICLLSQAKETLRDLGRIPHEPRHQVTTLLVSQEITHFFRTDIRLGELSFSLALQKCLSGPKSNA